MAVTFLQASPGIHDAFIQYGAIGAMALALFMLFIYIIKLGINFVINQVKLMREDMHTLVQVNQHNTSQFTEYLITNNAQQALAWHEVTGAVRSLQAAVEHLSENINRDA